MPSIKAPLAPHVIAVSEDTDLTTAYQMLKKAKARHGIALNSKKEISGVLSARDLERANHSSESPTANLSFSFEPGKTVKDFMSLSIELNPGSIPLTELSLRMIDKKISAFLISDQGLIQGVISSEDLLKIFHRLLLQKPENSRAHDLFFSSSAAHYLKKNSDFESNL